MKPIAINEDAPFHLNEYMSLRRFTTITAALWYTNNNPPAFLDHFFDVIEMTDSYNDHMLYEYIASWLNCLDESINPFLDKDCPGFMSVPRESHPLGNEYHTIGDGDNG